MIWFGELLASVIDRMIATIWEARKRILAVVSIGVLASVAFVLLPLWLDQPLQHATTGPWLRFWFATIAGNWPSEPAALIEAESITSYQYAVSAIIAVLLNNFLLGLIVGFVWRYITEGKRAMYLADALVLKDHYTKEALREALVSTFSEVFHRAGKADIDDATVDKLLDSAFDKGQSELEAKLPAITDNREEADKILEIIRTRQSLRNTQSYLTNG